MIIPLKYPRKLLYTGIFLYIDVYMILYKLDVWPSYKKSVHALTKA